MNSAIRFLLSVSCFTLVFNGGEAAFAQSLKVLRLSDVAPIPGASCEGFAAQQTEALTQYLVRAGIDGVTSIKGTCDRQSSRSGWSLVFDYQSTSRLPLVSTSFPAEPLAPGYASRIDCEAAISHETALFKQSTHLEIFMSYCKVPQFSAAVWTPVVVGFGSPKLTPFVSRSMLSGVNQTYDDRTLETVVRDYLVFKGIQVAQVQKRAELYQAELTVRGYATAPVRFEETIIAKFEDLEVCDRDLAGLRQALKGLDLPLVASYCQKAVVGGAVELVSLLEGAANLPVVVLNTMFKDRLGCEASLVATITDFENNLNRPVAYGMCSFDRILKTYREVLITEN